MDEMEQKQLENELSDLKRSLQEQASRIRDLERRLYAGDPQKPTVHYVKPSRAVNINVENFIGLRLIHLVGIVVLVIGLSIGVKYAIDKELISETMRILLAYLAGILLYLLSIRLKKKYNFFSAILFSGAMASVYFTTYAAYVYYSLFPFAVAFFLMVSFTVFTVSEALKYNRQEIAILGMVGAYGIPFLISQNAERVDLFFLYIALINAGVALLVFQKNWKLAGRIAQAITWLLLIGWAAVSYKPERQWMATGFMFYFFALFSFLSVRNVLKLKQPLSLNDIYQLVLNNIALYIAGLFVFGYSWKTADVATITLFNAILIGAEAVAFHFLWHEAFAKRILAMLSFTFLVIFVAFQWEGLTVTLLWLLLSVIVFAAGYRFHSVSARMSAITLMGVTLAKLVLVDSVLFSPEQKIISYIVLGILLLVISFFYQKFKERIFKNED